MWLSRTHAIKLRREKLRKIFSSIYIKMKKISTFMPHLATELGYSAGEFQAVQLIVLAAFGVVD